MTTHSATTKLIVGLGNPEKRYTDTRHNVGFWFSDLIQRQQNSTWQQHHKAPGQFLSCTLPDSPDKLVVYRQTVAMNICGRPLQQFCQYFKIPAQSILLVYDDLDLNAGMVRARNSGGHGGHNGVRDVLRHLDPHGTHIQRLRVGIGHPGDKNAVSHYVLSSPSTEEKQSISACLQHSVAQLPLWLSGPWDRFAQQVHHHNTTNP